MTKGTMCDICNVREATKHWIGGQDLCDEHYKEFKKRDEKLRKKIREELMERNVKKGKKEQKKEDGQTKLFL